MGWSHHAQCGAAPIPPAFLAKFFEMVPDVNQHYWFILVLAEFSLINLLLLFLMENIIIEFRLIERLFMRIISLCFKCCSIDDQSNLLYVNNEFIRNFSEACA